MDLIVPDLSATEVVDVRLMQIEHGISVGRTLLEMAKKKDDIKLAQRHVKDGEALLAEYQPDNPLTVTIGFLPARKRRELVTAQSVILRGKGEKDLLSEDEILRCDDLRREWLRWGVKGHSLGLDFEADAVEYRGRKHQVASENMLEVYEHMGLLHALAERIVEFNTLSGKKKTKSLPTSGVNPGTSTVPDADGTPA